MKHFSLVATLAPIDTQAAGPNAKTNTTGPAQRAKKSP
jgi:hypothetical protein